MTTHPEHPPIAAPVPSSYAEQAERYLEWGAGADGGARAITTGLLYVGAAIEAAARRRADDTDALAAMLDDRLTSIAEAIDAAWVLPLPLWRRVIARLRVHRPAPGHDLPGSTS
jgi:hypothetical protein